MSWWLPICHTRAQQIPDTANVFYPAPRSPVAVMDLSSLKALNTSEDFPQFRRRRTEDWSNDVGAPIHPDERPEGILSRLYQSIESFFSDALRKLADTEAQEAGPMSKPLYRLFDSVYGSFVDWGEEFKVGEGDLDDALRDSQDLRQYTITTLMGICETLTNGQPVHYILENMTTN